MLNKLFFSVIFSIICLAGNTQIIDAQKGLFEIRSNEGLPKDSFHIIRTWFNDSTTIQELKGYFSYDSLDVNIYKGYDVYKYVFFDLRTRKKQDYYSFTDTATLINNYSGNADNCLYADIHSEGGKFNAIDSLTKLADTIINQKNYKRIKYTERHTEHNYKFEYIYYLSCNTFKSEMVNINSVIENLYPGCIIERVDFNSISPIPIFSISESRIIRNSLTPEEQRIFECWKRNALVTTKPLITCEEIKNIRTIPVKFRSDPRFKQFGIQ